MAYSVTNDFRNRCYAGSSLYNCRLYVDETLVPISQISSITISSPIIDNSNKEQSFYIGTFISQQLTIKFKNLDGLNIVSGNEVELYISQYVNNDWEEVPIGKYLIDQLAENYQQTCEITCLDYAIKFSTNLDYSPSFTDGKVTIDDLLDWICDYYGVTLGSYPDTNGNVEISDYDSTVSGKRWISYIAEIKGCNAKMDREGQLTLVPVKSVPAVTIDALASKTWQLGEKYEISQVIYFDAIRNFTYGTDTENTLYIRQDNPFIVDTSVVENIYDEVNGLQIWSLTCENYGDISLDAWDTIAYTLGNDTYKTLNNNTIVYEITIMSKVETKIPTKQQEVTTNVVEGSSEQKFRRLGTEINQLDNQIKIYAEEQSDTAKKVSDLTITTDTIQANVTETTNNLSNQITALASSTSVQINAINQTLEDGVEKVANSLVTIDANGINTSSSEETFNTQITNKTFEVKDGTKPLAFIGYDATEQKTVARIPELEATKITAGNHRCEAITRNGEKRTAWYFIGGGN